MRRRSKQYYTFFRASRHCLHFNKFNFCLFSLPSCLSPSSPSAPASVSSCVLVGSVRGCPVSLVVSMLSLSCGSMVFVSRGIALFACQDCRYLKLGLEEISVMLMDGKSRAPLSRFANKSKWLASERGVKIDLLRGSETAWQRARNQRLSIFLPEASQDRDSKFSSAGGKWVWCDRKPPSGEIKEVV
jgi:hypothetical protein